jgi:hypothetical protein
MKVTRPNTFGIVDPNVKRVTEDMYKLTLRNISFGTEINGDDQNIAGQMVEVGLTGAANTQFTVTHNLGRVPLFYDVKYNNTAGVVYDSGTAWTTTQVFLKCSAASAKLILFIH